MPLWVSFLKSVVFLHRFGLRIIPASAQSEISWCQTHPMRQSSTSTETCDLCPQSAASNTLLPGQAAHNGPFLIGNIRWKVGSLTVLLMSIIRTQIDEYTYQFIKPMFLNPIPCQGCFHLTLCMTIKIYFLLVSIALLESIAPPRIDRAIPREYCLIVHWEVVIDS